MNKDETVRPKPLAWTDYPFASLGDTPNRPAPIRQIELLGYDGDKYVKVRVVADKSVHEIKAGYCFERQGRIGDVPPVRMSVLRRLRLREASNVKG